MNPACRSALRPGEWQPLTDESARRSAVLWLLIFCSHDSFWLDKEYRKVNTLLFAFPNVSNPTSSNSKTPSPGSRQKSSSNGDGRRHRPGIRSTSDENLRASLESDFDPHTLLRPVRNDDGHVVDFVFVEVNNAACSYNRLARAELIGQRLTRLFPNCKQSGLFEKYCRVLESGETLDLQEFPYQHEILGRTCFYNIRAVPVGGDLFFTWRDVSEPAKEAGEDQSRKSPATTAASQPLPLAMERRKAKSADGQAEMHVRELEMLVRQLLHAKEQQDQVISRELHDNIAQVLNAATNRISLVKGENITAWLRQELQDLREHLEIAITDVRTLARDLRPALLDHFGFAAALEKHADDFRQRTRLDLALNLQPEIVASLDTGDLTHLFRLTQEALQNIEEHSGAKQAWIHLHRNNGSIHLEIGDDGCSFTPERVMQAQAEGHLGLLGMRERVELLGGTFQLDSKPQRGTVIRVFIPFPDSESVDGSEFEI